MNLGEYQRTEEFPMVVPERVEPIIIPEKTPIRVSEPAEMPEKESVSE